MAHSNSASFAAKHDPDTHVDPTLAHAIQDASKEKTITCAAAFDICRQTGAAPAELGKNIDLLNYKIVKCQLGLFGYPPDKQYHGLQDMRPNQQVEAAVRRTAQGQRIPCADVWKIAAAEKVPKMTVGAACETMQIKVKPCQLGAF